MGVKTKNSVHVYISEYFERKKGELKKYKCHSAEQKKESTEHEQTLRVSA